MRFRSSPEQLIEEAERALAELDFRKARRVAAQLLRMRHTAGFEYEARALWEMGDAEGAINTLQQGLQVAPTLWILWEYLGHYLSDLARYPEAIDAFRQGLACEGAPRDSFLLNLAIVYQRMGDDDTALQMLEQALAALQAVPRAYLECSRAYSLIRLQRYTEAERALSVAEQTASEANPDLQETIYGMVAAFKGLIAWQRDNDLARAQQYAEQALRHDKTNPDAIHLMRAGNPIADRPTPLWHILVEGVWHEPVEGLQTPIGYFANYWVIAETPEEALEYIRPFEPPASRPTLRVAEATIEATVQGERKGVVRTLGNYLFFSERE